MARSWLGSIERARDRNQYLCHALAQPAERELKSRTYLHNWHDTHEYTFGKHRSLFEFGTEFPTRDDWDCWRQTLQSVTHNGNHPMSLGRWISPSPRIWRTFMVDNDNYIEVVTADGIDIYPRQQTRARRFKYDRRAVYTQPLGYPVKVEHPLTKMVFSAYRATAIGSQSP